MAMGNVAFTAALADLADQFKAGTLTVEQYGTQLAALYTEANSSVPALGDKIDALLAIKAAMIDAVAALGIRGTVAEISELPAVAAEGDAYKLVNIEDELDGHLFARISGAWEDLGPLIGGTGRSAYQAGVELEVIPEGMTEAQYVAAPLDAAALAEAKAALANTKAGLAQGAATAANDAADLAEAKAALANTKAGVAQDAATAADLARTDLATASAAIFDARDAAALSKAGAETARDAAVAALPGSSSDNRWRDAFFRALYDAVPVPPAANFAFNMDGLGRVLGQVTALTWDLTSSPFGNPCLAQAGGGASAYIEVSRHAAESPMVSGETVTDKMAFVMETGSTARLTTTTYDVSNTLVSTSQVSVAATGVYQELSNTYVMPSGVTKVGMRLSRSSGTGAAKLFGVASFKGASTRPMIEDRATRYFANKTSLLATSAMALATANAVGVANLNTVVTAGKNKFNVGGPYLADSQFATGGTGAIQTGSTWVGKRVYTDYAPVLPSTSYIANSAVNTAVAFYDASKAFISLLNTYAGAACVSPSNAAFMRFGVSDLTDTATLQIEAGTVVSTFEAYHLLIASVALPTMGTANLADKAVTPVKASFFAPGKNKFNVAGPYLINSQFSSGGALQTNVAFAGSVVYTDYFDVDPSTSYVTNSVVNARVVWYTSAKAIISSVTLNSSAPAASPSNAAYARLSIQPASITPETFQFEPGTVATSFESWRLYLLTSVIPTLPTVIADKSITPVKTSFFAAGKNKFNPAGPTLANSQFSSGGALQTNVAFAGSFVYTDFMPAEVASPYVSNSDVNARIVFYDAAFAILDTGLISATVSRVSPAGTAYYRVAIITASIPPATYQIEVADKPTFFEPYTQVVDARIRTSEVNASLKWAINDLTVPRKTYLLKGIENNFYHRCLQRRTVRDLFFTRMSGTVGGASVISRDRYSRITPTATGTANLTAILYDGEIDPLVTKTTSAIVTDPATPSTATTMLAIGDSWLDIGVILRTLINTVSGLSLVGSRKVTKIQGTTYSGPDIRFDGRSGADLAYIFTAIKSPSMPSTGFSPFIHPPGFNFIGNTNTWKDAMSATPGTFAQNLATTGAAMRGGFSVSTGYPATPQTNDLIWDDGLAAYKTWNGSAWVTASVVDADFVFDFTKYLSVYGVTAPKIVYAAMGVNDFGSKTPRDVAGSTGPFPATRSRFALWHKSDNTGYMDKLIAGVQAYDPTIKIGILVPAILSEDNNNSVGLFMTSYNAAMWEARKQILATWDTPAMEAAGVYVVDAGRAVDPRYGYTPTTVAPFNQYNEALTESLIVDTIHASGGASGGGFGQMGVALAAWVQGVR